MDHSTTLNDLKKTLEKFIQERDWQQFHTPKNIVMALSVEVAELMELYLWTEQQDSFAVTQEKLPYIKEEIADILAYILCFCNATGIDISDAFFAKIEQNAHKYPIEKSRGKSTKYTKL